MYPRRLSYPAVPASTGGRLKATSGEPGAVTSPGFGEGNRCPKERRRGVPAMAMGRGGSWRDAVEKGHVVKPASPANSMARSLAAQRRAGGDRASNREDGPDGSAPS